MPLLLYMESHWHPKPFNYQLAHLMNIIRTKHYLFILLAVAVCHSAFAAGDGGYIQSILQQIEHANADNAGLQLPAGFSASVLASGVGSARHIAVTPQGDVYVKARW